MDPTPVQRKCRRIATAATAIAMSATYVQEFGTHTTMVGRWPEGRHSRMVNSPATRSECAGASRTHKGTQYGCALDGTQEPLLATTQGLC